MGETKMLLPGVVMKLSNWALGARVGAEDRCRSEGTDDESRIPLSAVESGGFAHTSGWSGFAGDGIGA